MSGQSAAKYAAAHAPHRMPLNAPQTACKEEQPHEKDEGHQHQQTPPEPALCAEKNAGLTGNPQSRKETLRQCHGDDHQWQEQAPRQERAEPETTTVA